MVGRADLLAAPTADVSIVTIELLDEAHAVAADLPSDCLTARSSQSVGTTTGVLEAAMMSEC